MALYNNGFYIMNLTGWQARPSVLRLEAYDANRQRIGGPTGPVPLSHMRFISADHIGSPDHIYVLAFYDSPNYNPPPGIDIISGPSGRGGGAGIVILGFGGSASGSVTVTQAFSQPSMAAKMELQQFDNHNLKMLEDYAKVSAMVVTSVTNEDGDDVLKPMFVPDLSESANPKLAAVPGWNEDPKVSDTWSWGQSGDLISN